MVNSNRWSRKIVALLHDPPDKPFSITGHEGRAAELQRIALGRDATQDEMERAKRADRIASAADRVDLPPGAEAYWHREKAMLVHPLSGRKLELGSLADVDVTYTHESAKQAVRMLVEDKSDLQRRFLSLWRLLPETLANRFSRVGELFKMLPADTRQPDHSLIQHLSITAAIADALPQPALLVFSIGPVQRFIAAARRTQDLWMGSWLLSYMSWSAMKSIAEEFGPDVILFPSLRGQPLCDLWLASDKRILKRSPHSEDLALASLPNKFVALLPAPETRSAAEKAEKEVRDEWHQLTNEVLKAITSGVIPADPVTQRVWREQIETQLEIYWSVLPWMGTDKSDGKAQAEEVIEAFKALCAPPPDWPFGKSYALFAKPKEEGGGQYHPNWGTTYSLLYTLADRAFNARKSLRDFQPVEERGEKCTVCGRRAALSGKDGSRRGVRSFWASAADNLKAGGRRVEIKPGGQERLCAICAVKRFVRQEVLKGKIGLHGGFPSTSEMATASFKAGVLQKLEDPRYGERLIQALREYLGKLDSLSYPITTAGTHLPKLRMIWRRLNGIPLEVRVNHLERLLRYDGEVLFAETLTVKRLREEYGLEVKENDVISARESLMKLLDVAEEAGVPRPSKYYAILHMDGDRAGKWLSGTHEDLTSLGNLIHPKVREQLEDITGWRELLERKRLMTPALHTAISEALTNFALYLVRWVVEERYCGRVIYAGGDDVLALLALEDALPAARELRALFSGEVEIRNGDLKVRFGDSSCSGYLWFKGRPMLTMGPTATASIGIAIAHHLQPLDVALEAVRRAERTAKELYGRNALCVRLLMRSGGEMQMGGKWFYRNVNADMIDTIGLVDKVRDLFVRGLKEEEGLSMKFAHAVLEEGDTLAKLDPSAQKAELYRLIYRHSTGFDKAVRREAFAKALSYSFALLALQLQQHRNEWERRWYERHLKYPLPADEMEAPQPGIVQLARWLLLARFLARGGEE